MGRDVPGEPLVLHALPGRLRIHVPGWSAQDRPCLEGRLLRLRGVTHVQANPLTGNVLILYEPGATRRDILLGVLRDTHPAIPRLHRPPHLPRRLARMVLDSGRFAVWAAARPAPPAGLRLLAALLGLGLLGLCRLLRRRLAVLGTGALALNALALVQRLPTVRDHLGRFLGCGFAEVVRQVTDAAALVLSGSPISLAIAGGAALLQLPS